MEKAVPPFLKGGGIGGNNGGTGEPGSQKETDLTENFLQFYEYVLVYKGGNYKTKENIQNTVLDFNKILRRNFLLGRFSAESKLSFFRIIIL